MEKKNLSIFLFHKKEYPRLWLLIKILILLSFLFSPIGILCCGEEKGAKLKTKTNSPPVITSVNILPERPNKESELNLFIQSQDPDGDPITYQYQWLRNDDEIIGQNQNTLKKWKF